MIRTAALLLAAATALAACRAAPTTPAEQKRLLAVYGDSIIYTTAGGLSEELRVAVLDARTGGPISGVSVAWQLTAGTATLGRPVSTSDDGGIAGTWLVNVAQGTYRVQASTDRLEGRAPTLEVRVVPRPVVTAVQPASIAAGGEVTLTGSGFSTVIGDNAVYFDDVRGRVLAATATTLQVEVPQCLPSRTAAVRAGLGAVISEPASVQVTGTGGTLVTLARGGVTNLGGAEALRCIRLPGGQSNAAWLLVVHNAAAKSSPPVQFELRALEPQATTAATKLVVDAPARSFAAEWEAALRLRERELGAIEPLPIGPGLAARPAVPAVGSRRDFNVLNSSNQFRKVTATARVVGSRGVIYVDDEAESAFDASDLQYFSGLFDDPIHPTLVDVFGEPSDLDANQRIIILFTPQVNQLTPKGSTSFISGFFYGCDLVSRQRCSGTNQGEIFYALVPDPAARWGDARSRSTVMAAVPPVLAHEFQHMIHFARRGFSADALWLSEGLAHTAEGLVADVLEGRGQAVLAQSFRSGNHVRAQQYLGATARTQLISDELPGSLELRGGAWLFVRYAHAHYGGNDLLGRLTASTRSSVANVSHETGRSWPDLLGSFAVALWTSEAPELAGAALEPRYTFGGAFMPRVALGTPSGYPLRPAALPWRDLSVSGSVAAGGSAYFGLQSGAGSPPSLTFVLTGERGAPLNVEGMSLSLIRVN